MKKIISLICILSLSSPAWAYSNCNSGTEVSTTSGTYCVSSFTMNWWMAHAWCDGIGGKLATFATACSADTLYTECPILGNANPSLPGTVWTATGSGTSYAYYVTTAGAVGPNFRLLSRRALCE